MLALGQGIDYSVKTYSKNKICLMYFFFLKYVMVIIPYQYLMHAYIFFFHKFIYFYFWLHWIFVAQHGLSLVVASGCYSSLRCSGFSLRWLLLLQSTGSRHPSFSSCSTWAQQLWLAGCRAQAQQLWNMGLVAPWHVGSSWTRA